MDACRSVRAFSVLALTLFAESVSAGPASPVQTILSGHYKNNLSGNGYKTTASRFYTVGGSATFTDNVYDGLDASSSNVIVNGGAFSNNGVGLYASFSAVTVNGGTFSNNKEHALFADNGVTVIVNGGTFSNSGSDALVSNSGSVLTVSGGTFRDNGGGLVAEAGSRITVTGGIFTGNRKDLYIIPGAFLTLVGTGLKFTGSSPDATTLVASAGPLTGTVTGTLQNNAKPSCLSFQLYGGGRIILVNAPHPPHADAPSPLAVPLYRVTDLGSLGGGRFASAPVFGPDTIPEYSVFPTALNGCGEVVGYERDAAGRVTGFLWRRGRMRPLGAGFRPVAITDSGRIYGYQGPGLDAALVLWGRHGLTRVRWDPLRERVAALHLPKNLPWFSLSSTNARGQAVGVLRTQETDRPVAGLWQRGRLITLNGFGGFIEEADGINDRGQIVGMGGLGVGPERAALWLDWRLPACDLNERIAAHSGWRLGYATAISDRGQIVGRGTLRGRPRAFLLTPTSRQWQEIPDPVRYRVEAQVRAQASGDGGRSRLGSTPAAAAIGDEIAS